MMRADQLRAGRALLRWSQQQLADKAGVSVPTIKRLEAMDGELEGHTNTIKSLRTALESGGVMLVESNGNGPGVRLREKP